MVPAACCCSVCFCSVRVEQQLMSRMISEMYRPPPSDPTHNLSADHSELEEQSFTSDIGECTDGRTNQSRYLLTGTIAFTQCVCDFVVSRFLRCDVCLCCVFSGGGRRWWTAALCRLQRVGGLGAGQAAG